VPEHIPHHEQLKYLIEPSGLGQLRQIPEGFRAVWNSRDLQAQLAFYGRGEVLPHGLSLRVESFGDARKLWDNWLCQASNIASEKDVQHGAQAILVGTKLPEYILSVMPR
jgi:hypothetical protein